MQYLTKQSHYSHVSISVINKPLNIILTIEVTPFMLASSSLLCVIKLLCKHLYNSYSLHDCYVFRVINEPLSVLDTDSSSNTVMFTDSNAYGTLSLIMDILIHSVIPVRSHVPL